MKSTSLMTICVFALLLIITATASATIDYFSVGYCFGGVLDGGGTGYNNGQWYAGDDGWVVQWFYDHPLDYNRWKEIKLTFEITAQNSTTGAEIAINWSKPAWSEIEPHMDAPPIGLNTYIERQVIWSMAYMPALQTISDQIEFVIPDYNPEWVSIDVRGLTPTSCFILGSTSEETNFQATFEHNCVPEPVTLTLLGLGGLILRKRK